MEKKTITTQWDFSLIEYEMYTKVYRRVVHAYIFAMYCQCCYKKKKKGQLKMSYRRYSARVICVCTVEHLHSVWTVLRVEASHDQAGDHDKQAG